MKQGKFKVDGISTRDHGIFEIRVIKALVVARCRFSLKNDDYGWLNTKKAA